MSNVGDSVKTCFVTAPPGVPLGVLRESLNARGIRLVAPRELRLGSSWASEIQRELSQADLVVGVLTAKRESQWVLFELGQAWALGRRILLIASPKAGPIPSSLRGVVVIRAKATNREAVNFALDQLLSAPATPPRPPAEPTGPSKQGLGDRVDTLLADLDRAVAANDNEGIQNLTTQALKGAGADLVVASKKPELGADLAVWSDLLEPLLGNPLLIDVKSRLLGASETRKHTQELATYAAAAGNPWALLLYAEGPPQAERLWHATHPTVFVLSLRSLIQALRSRSFPEVIRDLRNQRVHGLPS